jgi:hypothetical protein
MKSRVSERPGVSVWIAALLFAGLQLAVVVFQLALALGAPWGAYAMGGVHPGAYPPAMRLAALGQAAVLGLMGLVVLARAGVVLPVWRRAAHVLIWPVVVLLAASLVLNLITPSGGERLVWAPVAALLFAASLRIALIRPERSRPERS